MRKTVVVLMATMMVGMTIPAFAELKDVKVGGSLRMRGNWYSEEDLDFENGTSNDALFVEQRTTVNVLASLTDDVSAFIEIDNYDFWGDDFRGLDADGVLTGVDGLGASEDSSEFPCRGCIPGRGIQGVSGDDGSLALYQGYIEMKEVWSLPVSVRIGRQEIQLGSEFLIGNNDTGSSFRGLSFDSVTTSTPLGDFTLQTWYAKLVRNNNPVRLESSGDIWFNGTSLSYAGFEGMTIDLYGIRYKASSNDVYEALGIPDSVQFYTAGLRFAGTKAHFDWDIEGAYQFGDSGLADVPGVSSDEVSAIGATAKAGYTFDVKMQPRIFLNGAYFSGDEENPAFNRLFSDHEYSEFIDSTDLSNVWLVGGGVSAQLTESLGLTGAVNYFQVVEDFGASDDDLGFEFALYASYQYSEELSFNAGYSHFMAGDGVEDGQFVVASGTEAIGGAGEADDLDYAFIETRIRF